MSESLTLKWGTLKSWNVETEASKAALQKYWDGGLVSASAIMQHNTPAQTEAVIELIDVIECDEICLDWTGEWVTKEKAKEYVRNYKRPQADEPTAPQE